MLRRRKKRVGLQRIHIEEDAGKTSTCRADERRWSISTAPECRSSKWCRCPKFVRRKKRQNTCEPCVNWSVFWEFPTENGRRIAALRCQRVDSSTRPNDAGPAHRAENINSFKYVQHAIEHEILRQIDVVQSGGKVVMETRGWDAARGTSRSQRKKNKRTTIATCPTRICRRFISIRCGLIRSAQRCQRRRCSVGIATSIGWGCRPMMHRC